MTHRWNHNCDRNFDVFGVIRHKLMIMMTIGPMILLKPQSWDSQVWKSHNFDVIWSIGLRVIKSVPNLSQMSLISSFYRSPSQKWTLQLSHQQNQESRWNSIVFWGRITCLSVFPVFASIQRARPLDPTDPSVSFLSALSVRCLDWSPPHRFSGHPCLVFVVSHLQFQSTSAPSAIFLTRLPLKFCSLVKSDHSWPSLSLTAPSVPTEPRHLSPIMKSSGLHNWGSGWLMSSQVAHSTSNFSALSSSRPPKCSPQKLPCPKSSPEKLPSQIFPVRKYNTLNLIPSQNALPKI